jgi:hypothetical protein
MRGRFGVLRPAVDMASAVAAPRELGQPQQGLIHSILARTEERLAATLDAHAAPTTELHRAPYGVAAMLDCLTVLYTPELPDMKDGAVATAKRRYSNWRRAVDRLIRAGGVNGQAAGGAGEDQE